MHRILIAAERHGTRYFDASTDVKLAQACCKLLRERLAALYYDPGPAPTAETIGDAVIAGLPPDVQVTANRHNMLLAADRKQHAKAVSFLSLVQEVLAAPQILRSGKQVRAWSLLRSRTDHQYEAVELEELEMGSETIRPGYISEELHFRMEQEGWAIFDHDGRAQVMKLDELGKLTDDVQAWELAGMAGLVIDEEGYLDELQPVRNC